MFFSKRNFVLLGLSCALLAIGYVLLGQGPASNPLSLSVAPVVLVAAYCIFLPLSIVVRGKKEDERS